MSMTGRCLVFILLAPSCRAAGPTTTATWTGACANTDDLSYVTGIGDCRSEVPLSQACGRLYDQVDTYPRADEFPDLSVENCAGVTFDEVAYILEFDRSASGGFVVPYHCGGESGYDAIEFVSASYRNFTDAVYDPPEYAWFDASGRLFAYAQGSGSEARYCCRDDDGVLRGGEAVWWGTPVLDGCPDREDYTTSDFADLAPP